MNRRSFLRVPLALAASRCSAPLWAADQRPNIVLIVASGWRAQSVPWAGDSDVAAPNLGRLAGRGVTYSRAYACYPRSERARLGLRTGMFPHAIAAAGGLSDGDTGDAAAIPDQADPRPTPINLVLRNAGYRTAAFSSLQADELISFVHTEKGPFLVEWTFEDIGAQLMERRDATELHLRENVPAGSQDTARADLTNFYSRAVTRDRDIGVVLEALDRPAIADNTLIVFTSDHGEQFGSHGIVGSDSPYEESMRIPLAIFYPRSMRGGRPGQNDTLISQTDLLPSLLKLCGVPIPSTVQGRDLSAALLGNTSNRPDDVYAEGHIGQKDEWRMLIRGFDKLVVDMDGKVTHLFNLADDPFEQNNRAEVSGDALKRDSLLALQKVWARKLSDGVDASGLKKR